MLRRHHGGRVVIKFQVKQNGKSIAPRGRWEGILFHPAAQPLKGLRGEINPFQALPTDGDGAAVGNKFMEIKMESNKAQSPIDPTAAPKGRWG